MLMNEIKIIAKEKGCDRIELTCWSFNKNALEFYKNYGMRVQKLTMEMKV